VGSGGQAAITAAAALGGQAIAGRFQGRNQERMEASAASTNVCPVAKPAWWALWLRPMSMRSPPKNPNPRTRQTLLDTALGYCKAPASRGSEPACYYVPCTMRSIACKGRPLSRRMSS
jgi:hypothetical protein